MEKQKYYLCIDLKSFYASVECMERGLDPMTTNLVVADASRTEKTICLAVTPSLKAYGIPGRARLFEVVSEVSMINASRRSLAPGKKFTGKSYDSKDLASNSSLELDYIIAPPRMAYYMEYSTQIYDIYLEYVAHEDIHVYSIDEVFIDITSYLKTANMSARDFAMTIIKDVYSATGITATAGIGENLYLAKIAMDIVAKNIEPDENGVRIAELDEISYRKKLWNHRPLTDFWRIGKGYSKKLEANGLYTMGDIARVSLSQQGEDHLYKLFGVNAELLIDHAWGWEPCTISDIKAYRPENQSISSGQVLHCPYEFEKTKLIVKEMAELLSLDLAEKNLVTDQIVLTVGYDIENLANPEIKKLYCGEITTDFYGRKVPKHAHGTANLGRQTSSSILISKATIELFEKITDKNMLSRRLTIVANHIVPKSMLKDEPKYEQIDWFTDYEEKERENEKEEMLLEKERKIQQTTLELKKRFGKNAILKGFNLKEGATTIDRNSQIGGHKA